MAPQFSKGQTVHYKPVGGPTSRTSESTGVIRDVLTESGQQASRNVKASPENPRYEVSSPFPRERRANEERGKQS